MLCIAAGTLAEGAFTEDLLPASGLVTSSDEYYPTVAINALMRLLRDPSLSSHHFQVLRSLFVIFRSLHLAAVPYLTKVINLLANATCCCLRQTSSNCGSSLVVQMQPRLLTTRNGSHSDSVPPTSSA